MNILESWSQCGQEILPSACTSMCSLKRVKVTYLCNIYSESTFSLGLVQYSKLICIVPYKFFAKIWDPFGKMQYSNLSLNCVVQYWKLCLLLPVLVFAIPKLFATDLTPKQNRCQKNWNIYSLHFSPNTHTCVLH